jgi:hypothetical protein
MERLLKTIPCERGELFYRAAGNRLWFLRQDLKTKGREPGDDRCGGVALSVPSGQLPQRGSQGGAAGTDDS